VDVKGNQFSVKVYETSIEDEEVFMAFFDANYTLFKDHLISIQGELSSTIRAYLEAKPLCYMHNIKTPISRTRKELAEALESQHLETKAKQEMIEEELAKLSERLDNNLTVRDSMVRSGQEVRIEGDLLLLNRVNSGATIHTTGNLIITQVVEGDIRCYGSFMMISASPKANIIFNGLTVKNELLEDRLNRIELVNHRLVITPVLKKEINWA